MARSVTITVVENAYSFEGETTPSCIPPPPAGGGRIMGKLASALGRHGGDVSSTLSVRQMIGGDFLTGLTARPAPAPCVIRSISHRSSARPTRSTMRLSLHCTGRDRFDAGFHETSPCRRAPSTEPPRGRGGASCREDVAYGYVVPSVSRRFVGLVWRAAGSWQSACR